MKKTLIVLLTAAVSAAGISAAFAADTQETSTGQLTVKAFLKEGCSINFDGAGANGVIDFGTISALSNPMRQDGHFTVSCSQLKGQTNSYQATSVALDKGNITGSTVENRLLGNGNSTLNFQVYQGSINAGDTTVWGDGSGIAASAYPVDVSSGQDTTYDYHVTLLAQDLKDKNAGLYQNTMIATVNYAASDGQTP